MKKIYRCIKVKLQKTKPIYFFLSNALCLAVLCQARIFTKETNVKCGAHLAAAHSNCRMIALCVALKATEQCAAKTQRE